MGNITRITRVNDVKFIDGLDIEEHNECKWNSYLMLKVICQ